MTVALLTLNYSMLPPLLHLIFVIPGAAVCTGLLYWMPAPRGHSSLFHSCLCTVHRCAELQVSSSASCYCSSPNCYPFMSLCMCTGTKWSLSLELVEEEKVWSWCATYVHGILSVWMFSLSLSLSLSLSYFPLWNLAAKAALHRFLQSKEATQREKDLLKSTKVTLHSETLSLPCTTFSLACGFSYDHIFTLLTVARL